MIFVQPFVDNFCNNLLFLSFYWSKIIEKKKEEKQQECHVSMRELYKSCHNCCTNIISHTSLD